MSVLRGVIAPVLTPFDNSGGVALDLYVDIAKRLLSEGCVGLAPFGTTGEALSVGMKERMQALEALIQGGVDPSRLIPGAGLTNLPDTARLCRHAVELGCAGVMTLPPFYFKNVADDGLYAYFSELIQRVAHPGLRIYLYHIPQVSGVGIPPGVVERLHLAFPQQVVGIKDSSGNWENTSALLDIEGLIVYPGSELPLIQAMERGAPGCISATANLNAAAIAEVIACASGGDVRAAREKHERVKRFRLVMQDYAPIPAQKRLLAMQTRDNRWANVRPPLLPMPEPAGIALLARLSDLGETPAAAQD